MMAYGWYHIFYGQREKIEIAREKLWARIYLTPLLQAEEDRDQVRRYYADLSREKELLGRETRVYDSDRYVRFPTS
jgi:NADH dehydrogenase (ubiquinone) 1 alpha subcomplex subunit 13